MTNRQIARIECSTDAELVAMLAKANRDEAEVIENEMRLREKGDELAAYHASVTR